MRIIAPANPEVAAAVGPSALRIAEVTTRRPLPLSAAAALEILMRAGRAMHRNDLELHMHQSGFDGRAVLEALKAFERRGWIVSKGSRIVISDEASPPQPLAASKLVGKRRRRKPNLFG